METKTALIFVPGGPWISGQYWDQFIKNNFREFCSIRHKLVNHEDQYRRSSTPDLFNAVSKLDDDIKKINGKKTIIAHSYGAWLVLLWMRTFQKQNEANFIFSNMPTNQDRTPEINNFIKSLDNYSISSNENFRSYFSKLLPFYFYRNLLASNFDYITKDCFMEGNENLLINNQLLHELIEFSGNLKNIHYIFADNDLITGNSWKASIEDASTIQECGHFPMLEAPESFSKKIFSLL